MTIESNIIKIFEQSMKNFSSWQFNKLRFLEYKILIDDGHYKPVSKDRKGKFSLKDTNYNSLIKRIKVCYIREIV